jgi:ABC-type multidrug transport system fused ATPase/permease subunit
MEYQRIPADSTSSPFTGENDYNQQSSSNDYRNATRYDQNEAPTVNSTNPNYHPTTPTNNNNSWEKNNPVIESTVDKTKKTQQQAEDIVTKTKKLVAQNWEHTRQTVVHLQKKLTEMAPKEGGNLIYWRNPILSGIVFGVSLAVIITFMFLSSLAAVSFWLLALLIIVGLHKLYNYVMATFVGRVQDDIFDSIFPPDVNISERQAQALANYVRANGTTILKQARNLFLWNNLTNSVIFGLVLFVFFYIGLSMNALTFALVGLIFLFTVPKIYQVYQVPIDRTAKQALDQINQLLAKVTSKLPNKSKKA